MATASNSPGAPGSPPVRRPLSRLVPALAGLEFAVHMATAGVLPLHRDELYYLMCGRHPAWGYPDHPPLAPWLAAVSEHFFGLSTWGLRIWPALAGAAVVLLAGWLTARFGGGRLAQFLATLAVLLAPIYLITGSLMQTVPLDQLFWVAGAAVLVAVLDGGKPRRLVGLGLVLGLATWAKLTVLAWGFGLLVGLLLTPERRLLRRGWLWLGALIGAGLAAPVVLWQARHGWPVIEFMTNSRANDPVGPAEFLLTQIGMTGPLVGTALLVAGFGFLLRSPAGRRWRVLGVAAAVAWVVFLVSGGKPYYVGPTYPVLFAGGAVLIERRLARNRSHTWRNLTVGLLVSQVLAVPFFLPLIPPRHLGGIVDKLPNDDWVNMLGWREIATQLAGIHRDLTPDERVGLRVLAPNYGVAGAVDLYGAALGLPPAISAHNGYFFWEDAPALDPLLVVGYDPDWLRRTYAEVRELGTISGAELGPPAEQGKGIFYCRGLQREPGPLWQDLRHFE